MPLDPAAAARFLRGRVIAPGDLRHDANIFTIQRCLLASAVIFSHAFEVTGHHLGDGDDPTRMVLPYPVSHLAVLLFFSLSGFLVTGSLIKRGVRDFALARALRLLPGLWVMLAVSTLVLGLCFNTGSLADLLASARLPRYVGYNALTLGKEYQLDGIFMGNPIPTAINGSLWTIPQEVRCYVALALLGALGLIASRRLLTIGFAILVVVGIVVPYDAIDVLTPLRPLAVSFFFGVLLYLWRDRVLLSWPLAVATVAAGLALAAIMVSDTGFALAAAYATLVAAIRVPESWKRFSAALPDYSYGIYIYAFPAQQAAIALGIGTTAYANAVTGFLLTLPFAAASWHFVEKPALALKPRWTRPLVGVPARAAG